MNIQKLDIYIIMPIFWSVGIQKFETQELGWAQQEKFPNNYFLESGFNSNQTTVFLPKFYYGSKFNFLLDATASLEMTPCQLVYEQALISVVFFRNKNESESFFPLNQLIYVVPAQLFLIRWTKVTNPEEVCDN